MNRRTTFLAMALVAVALMPMACSSDNSTSSSTTTSATASLVTTTSPVTTATSTAAPSTSSSPGASISTTTTATSITPATTAVASTSTPTATTVAPPATSTAPSTTTDDVAATKAAVAAAAVAARQNYQYALENYDAPDALDVLARTTAANSPSWVLTLKNMDTLRTNGWKSRANPAVPSVTIVESGVDLLDGPPATRAQLTVCTIDSDILVKPGGAPDGSDVVVNDEVTARRNRVTMVLENGAWKTADGTTLQSWPGSTCPAA